VRNTRDDMAAETGMCHEPDKHGARELAPLTDFQTALWASHRLDRDNTAHNAPLLVEWECELEVGRFERAFADVVRVTDSLRIVFEQSAGEVRQRALDLVSLDLPHRDFSCHEDPRQAALNWMSEIAAEPHALRTTPFRAALARLGERKWIWLLDQHHILTDYSSKSLILSRLDHFYRIGPQEAIPMEKFPEFLTLVPRIREDDDKSPRRYNGETSDLFGERIVTSKDQPDPEMLMHHFSMACPEAESLKGRKELFDRLGAALTGLVAAISAKGRFQIGLVMNRRKRLQAGAYCGPILRTDPLTLSLPDNPTGADVAQEWRRAVQDMKRKHGLATDPLPQDRVVFNFTLDPLPDFNGSRTVEVTHEIAVRRTSDGIRLTARPGSEPGTIRLILLLGPQLARATGGAAVVGRHLLKLIEFLAAEPSSSMSAVDFLDGRSAEMERQLAEAAFSIDPEMPATLVDAFLRKTAAHPDAIAVSEGERRLTYRDLDDVSRKLVAALVKRSVEPGDVVIVGLPRSIDWVVTALAIFRLGAVFCPMDATASEERVHAIIRQTRAALRIATSTEWAPELSVTMQDLLTTGGPEQPDSRPTGADRAYLIFTSGSTGAPKGVVVRHRSLIRFLHWYKGNVGLEASSVFGFTSAPFFDMTLRVFTMFLVGGEIRVYPEEAGRLAVLSAVLEDRASFLVCTPSIAAATLQFPDLPRPSRLKTFSVGGEGFSSLLYAKLRAFLGPEVRIVNNYGPTETTVAVATREISGDPAGSSAGKPFILPVGKAMPNSYFLIVNRDLRPLPPGFVGEICIGGDQLAEGYFEQPAETQRAFIPSLCDADRRLYRTGDLGRLTPDGTLVLLGRADRQIKFNGIRIEPMQVEMALMNHPDVGDAVVALRGDPATLYGWYVSERDVPPAELRQVALKSIQPGMFPTRLIRVGQIPRSPNGKREPASLPDHEETRALPLSSAASRAPEAGDRDIITQTVISIWSDVLQRTTAWDPDVGFDDLGGDSLSAMRMIFEVEHLFGIVLDQVGFAEINSVRTLAAKIRSIKAEGGKARPRNLPAEMSSESDAVINNVLLGVRRLLEMWPGEAVGDSGLIRVLNKAGRKPPLIWCFNDLSEPENLAAVLGADRPLYILRSAHGLIDRQLKESSEVQIAAIYARAIFAAIGRGPVAVGGNCQGARIALMLANTLLQLKMDVATALLVEPAFLVPYPRRVMLLPGTDYSQINPVFSYANPQLGWNRYFRDYRVAMIRGAHGEYFRPENVGSLAELAEGEMDAAFELPSLRAEPSGQTANLTILSVPEQWQAGTLGVVELRLAAMAGCHLVMTEDSGITVSFRWDTDVPLCELPRPASGFPSQRVLRDGESSLERFSIQPPRAPGRYTLIVQLCEEGVGYLGEQARLSVNLT
jgi:amino acid adenylation domain-containing protein